MTIKTFNAQQFWDDLNIFKELLWPVITLDFNGVFDQYGGWNGQVETYPPADGLDLFLQEINRQFKTVVVTSATMPIETVEKWLREYGYDQYIDYVTNHKVPSAVYVDDRAVTHSGNFEDTLKKVSNFRPHWESGHLLLLLLQGYRFLCLTIWTYPPIHHFLPT